MLGKRVNLLWLLAYFLLPPRINNIPENKRFGWHVELLQSTQI
jgi:hypothetical protein